MNKIRNILKIIGPGILFAGAAIGVSHLVQSTRAGASYGFTLVWLVILTNFLKYPFFEYSHRYTSATGESLLTGYKRMGNWAIISFTILSLISSFITISAIALVTTGLTENLFNTGLSVIQLCTILLVVIVAILLIGKYHLLENMMKVMIVVLSVTTIIALIAAIQHGSNVKPDFIPPDLFSTVGLGFMLALMGWMPAPIEVSVWPSLWALERQKNTHHTATLKESLTDFYVGYASASVLALVFLSLGALVMYGTGETFSNSGTVFASQLVQLYTQSLGKWSFIFISVAALITMFSTLITVIDAYPRVMSGSFSLIFKHPFFKKIDRAYWMWVVLFTIGTITIIMFFTSSMKNLVDIATILAFLTAPLFAWLNLKTVTGKNVPKEFQPPAWLKGISYVGLVYLLGFGFYYLYIRLM